MTVSETTGNASILLIYDNTLGKGIGMTKGEGRIWQVPSQDNLLSWLEIWRKTWPTKMNLGRSRLHFRGNKKSCGYYGTKWELSEGIVDMMDKRYLNTSNVPSLWQETGINKQFYVSNSSHRNFEVWQTSGDVLSDTSRGSRYRQWGAFKLPLTTTNCDW